MPYPMRSEPRMTRSELSLQHQIGAATDQDAYAQITDPYVP